MLREMNGMYQTLCPTLGYRVEHLLTCQGVSAVGLHSSLCSKPDHKTLLPESPWARHCSEGGRIKIQIMMHFNRNFSPGRCPVPIHQSRDSAMSAGGKCRPVVYTVADWQLPVQVHSLQQETRLPYVGDLGDQLSMFHLMILTNGRPQSNRSRCVRSRRVADEDAEAVEHGVLGLRGRHPLVRICCSPPSGEKGSRGALSRDLYQTSDGSTACFSPSLRTCSFLTSLFIGFRMS